VNTEIVCSYFSGESQLSTGSSNGLTLTNQTFDSISADNYFQAM